MVKVIKTILLLSIVLAMLLCATSWAVAPGGGYGGGGGGHGGGGYGGGGGGHGGGGAEVVTEPKTVYIYEWSDFDELRDDVENGASKGNTYMLTAHLDFSEYDGEYWEPIGTTERPFEGLFSGWCDGDCDDEGCDSDDYSINNVVLNNFVFNSDQEYLGDIGFFGVTQGATIIYLTLNNISLTIDDETISSVCMEYYGDWPDTFNISNIGLLAGQFNGGVIFDSRVNGEINITATGYETEINWINIMYVGGLVGSGAYFEDEEANDDKSFGGKSHGKSHGKSYGGKFHGGGPKYGPTPGSEESDDGPEITSILFSRSDVNIQIAEAGHDFSNINSIGGLIGSIDTAYIIECASFGTIDVEAAGVGSIGGLAGYATETLINFCYSTMEINVNANLWTTDVGGIVGFFSNGYLFDSFATGDINLNAHDVGGEGAVGGLAGSLYNGGIVSCFSAGDITITAIQTENIGGITGNSFDGWITSCYTTGDIIITTEGLRCIGGIIGNFYYGYMYDCYVTGDIIVDQIEDGEEYWAEYIGGIAGYFYGYAMGNCYALNEKVAVNFDEMECIGRIAGYYEEVGLIEPCIEALDELIEAEEPEPDYNYAWNKMIGTFTTVLENEKPIASSAVWNKMDWITGGFNIWTLNNYKDFKLPVLSWYLDNWWGTFEADASHLKPSGGNRGQSTGQATVVDPAPRNPTNTTNPATSSNGNERNDAPPNDDTPPATPPAEKSGFNWTLALIILFILLVLGAVGYYLYKKGQV